MLPLLLLRQGFPHEYPDCGRREVKAFQHPTPTAARPPHTHVTGVEAESLAAVPLFPAATTTGVVETVATSPPQRIFIVIAAECRHRQILDPR